MNKINKKSVWMWSLYTCLLCFSLTVNAIVNKQILDKNDIALKQTPNYVPKNQAVGTILVTKGTVSIRSIKGAKRKGANRSPLYVGDRVETGKKGYAQIVFIDGSSLRLARNSDFTIQNYYFDEDHGKAEHAISIDEGTLAFFAGKISKIAPENYKISTETAVIGIRGSAGELRVTAPKSLSKRLQARREARERRELQGFKGRRTVRSRTIPTNTEASEKGHVDVSVSRNHQLLIETKGFRPKSFLLSDPNQYVRIANRGKNRPVNISYAPKPPGSWVDQEVESTEEKQGVEKEEEEEEKKKDVDEEEEKKEDANEEGEKKEENKLIEEEADNKDPFEDVTEDKEAIPDEGKEEEPFALVLDEDPEIPEETAVETQQLEIVNNIQSTATETANTTIEQTSNDVTYEALEETVETANTQNSTTETPVEEVVVIPTPDEYIHTAAADPTLTGYNDILDNIEWQYISSAIPFSLTDLQYPDVKVWDPVSESLELIDHVTFGANPPSGQEFAGQAALIVRGETGWNWGIGDTTGYVNFNGISIQKNLDSDRSFGLNEGVLDIANQSYYFLTFHPRQDGFLDATSNPSLNDYLIITAERGTVDPNASSYIQTNHHLFSLNPFTTSTLYTGASNPFDFGNDTFRQDTQLQWSGATYPEILPTYQWAIIAGDNSHAIGVTRGVKTTSPLVNSGTAFSGTSVGFSFNSTAHELENSFSDLTILAESDYALDLPVGGTSIGNTLISATNGANFFISKDAFFTELDSGFTSGKSYISGLPGLNNFANISWGIWAKEVSGSNDPSFGYLAVGLESARTQASEITALASANTFVNYAGPAMGSVFTDSNVGAIQFGSAHFSINFGSGSMSGGIDYSDHAIEFSNATINATSGMATGLASFSDGTSNTGAFRMDFFGTNATEAVGNYSVNGINSSLQNRTGLGSFGVRTQP